MPSPTPYLNTAGYSATSISCHRLRGVTSHRPSCDLRTTGRYAAEVRLTHGTDVLVRPTRGQKQTSLKDPECRLQIPAVYKHVGPFRRNRNTTSQSGAHVCILCAQKTCYIHEGTATASKARYGRLKPKSTAMPPVCTRRYCSCDVYIPTL
jgi:hypothetical protein